MFWLLIILAIGIWAIYYRRQRRQIYKVAREIPFCNLPTLPLLGNAHLFAESDEVIADPVVAEIVLKSCLEKDDTTMKFVRTLTGKGSLATPGSTYAMMSMKTVLATLVRQYRLLPPADLDPQQWTAPLRVKWDIMMKHVDNYMIRINSRKLCI